MTDDPMPDAMAEAIRDANPVEFSKLLSQDIHKMVMNSCGDNLGIGLTALTHAMGEIIGATVYAMGAGEKTLKEAADIATTQVIDAARLTIEELKARSVN